jgi:hypothetical protein
MAVITFFSHQIYKKRCDPLPSKLAMICYPYVRTNAVVRTGVNKLTNKKGVWWACNGAYVSFSCFTLQKIAIGLTKYKIVDLKLLILAAIHLQIASRNAERTIYDVSRLSKQFSTSTYFVQN